MMCRACSGGTEAWGSAGSEFEPVLLAEDVKQLVLVCGYSSPVGVGAVHVGSHRVGHDLTVGVVLSPLRDRIGQVLADHALKGLAVARPVQAAKELSSDRFSNTTTTM
jgi:hypothetical protein